jgi:hypothetical protein
VIKSYESENLPHEYAVTIEGETDGLMKVQTDAEKINDRSWLLAGNVQTPYSLL